MTTDAIATAPTEQPRQGIPLLIVGIGRGLQAGIIASGLLLAGAALLEWLFRPALQAGDVEENFTQTLAALLVGLLPAVFCAAGGFAVRRSRKDHFLGALTAACIVAAIGYALLVAYQMATGSGVFREVSTLGFTMRQTEAGIEVVAIDPGGSAEEAGLQPGDIITALRRDPVTADELQTLISQAQVDDAMRLRIIREGEELQLNTRVRLISQTDAAALLRNLIFALIIASIAVILPSAWTPHIFLLVMLVPLFVGYLWLILASFSERTHGLIPVDRNGNFGGWTLSNWDFLAGSSIGGPAANIFAVTLNSFVVAVAMTVASLAICSMTGYALSRMTFPGRQTFLSMSLILHGFPAVTLLIPIFLVLINLSNLPIIGDLVGYNTTGGIALVMIAFELPLGVWLMKGFFDTIPWDMERSALIDGASRWRTFWEIILPQIRPGLLALGIFSFINGWNAYLIPATYSVGTGMTTLPVYIRQLTGELAAVNWNQVAAVGLFQLIPIVIFFVFAQEYLLNIYAGGTKGSS
jgi:inositol-phosphate transport system permease protein